MIGSEQARQIAELRDFTAQLSYDATKKVKIQINLINLDMV